MQLLDEIIADATSDEVRLNVLLRKTLVLASQLRNASLKEWARGELDGYRNADDVPDYRRIRITARGDFISTAFMMNGQSLVPGLMETEHQFWAETANLAQGVAAYERAREHDGNVRVDWPQNLVYLYRDKFFQGYEMLRAWQEIPVSSIVSLLDTVRNRLLELALDLQEQLGDSPETLKDLSPERVQNAVTNYIFGGNNVIAEKIAGGVRQAGTNIVVEGDFQSLRKTLVDAGVPEDAVTDLKAAIDEDQAAGAKKGMGAKVGTWLAERGENFGDGVSAALVAQYLFQYLGIS